MFYPDDVPSILAPPPAATEPTCCRQRTVELGEDAVGKLRQRYELGTDPWIRDFNRRTFVEGGFEFYATPPSAGSHAGCSVSSEQSK